MTTDDESTSEQDETEDTPLGFDEKVAVYERFFHDELTREEAKEIIGDEWPEVAQVATAEQCIEEQQPLTDEELREVFND